MKVHLKFKSFVYAKDAAEFLYKLHPLVLKRALDLKKRLGSILGFIDLGNLTYEQREQLTEFRFKDENLP